MLSHPALKIHQRMIELSARLPMRLVRAQLCNGMRMILKGRQCMQGLLQQPAC